MKADLETNEQALDWTSTAGNEHRSRVLIVDDERGPRESLRIILSSRHRVRTARNAAEALDTLRSKAIDLVTLDLNMPGMKGDELMRTIRAEFPRTEIIIITGCGSVETAVQGIRHGAFDYLTKPFDVTQVLASVERALARRQGHQRMACLLEGIRHALDRNRDANVVLAELAVLHEEARKQFEPDHALELNKRGAA